MTDAQRRYMHARDKVMSLFVVPATELLEATASLVGEHKREADKNQSLHTTISVLRNMNEDGQFGARVALEEIWGFLEVSNQTECMELLRSMVKDTESTLFGRGSERD